MRDAPSIHIGMLVVYAPESAVEPLLEFAQALADEAAAVLKKQTAANWVFHVEEATRLDSGAERHPPDFMDEASLRMAEAPYDAIAVITNVPLISRQRQPVAGLASPISRIVVISTRRLISSPRGESRRALDAPAVHTNGITLLLHLLGHLLGLQHDSGLMEPFHFDAARSKVPDFSAVSRDQLTRLVDRFPQHSKAAGGFGATLLFHLQTALRHPRTVLRPLLRNRAPLLALALPRLATAAVVPTFILVFSAEIWDVALRLPDHVAFVSSLGSILAATLYLVFGLNLFFPQKERRVITEHAAVVNSAIFVSVLVGMIGLFVMIALVMLAIEFFVFPPDLMKEWPSLDNPTVTLADQVRLAAFISALGVITGALAGGLESRTVVRQFALFLRRP